MQLISLLLTLTTLVQAVPFYERLDARWGWNRKNRFCNKVIEVIDIFNEQAQATSFCSAYLGIPLDTTTVTTTSITTTSTETVTTTTETVTKTVATAAAAASVTVTAAPTTVTASQCTTVTSTVTSTYSQTISTCAPPTTSTFAAPHPKLAKRYRGYRKNPQCFTTYSSGAQLSSACSCLSIQPSTTTTTTTLCVATCTTVTTCAAATISVTATSTCTVTTTPTVSITITTTSTATSTTTTTTGILAFPTFLVEVQGGNNNGRFFAAATDGSYRIADTKTQDKASAFKIVNLGGNFGNGQLVVANGKHAGFNLYEDPSMTYDNFFDYVFINSSAAGHIPNHGSARPINCNIVQPQGIPTCALMCVGLAGTVSYDCAGDWHLGPYAPSATYNSQCQGSVFQPYVVGHV